MTGYFSRITRQSGARFAGDAGRPGRAASDRMDRPPLAIEQDETVMVSPENSSLSTRGRIGNEPAPPKAKPLGRRTTSEPVTPARGPSLEKKAIVAPTVSTPQPVVESVRLVPSDQPRDSEVVMEPPAITPPNDNGHEEVKEISPDTSPGVTRTDPPITDAITIQPSEKKFFEKTTELIESQTDAPQEIQTVLLREVQEWIAAGQPVSSEISTDVPTVFETMQEHEPTPTSERQPGVVRILEGRRPDQTIEKIEESPASPPTSLNEQNFELSIGSITVVVEGDDKVPAPAPVVATARPNAGEAPRRVSRLSRHYL